MPTRSEPTSPGPCVTPMASSSSNRRPASAMASRTTGTICRRCSREASSGTTPPYLRWISIWEATTLERMVRPFTTTAAAVSSQEDSMPRILMARWLMVESIGIGGLRLIIDYWWGVRQCEARREAEKRFLAGPTRSCAGWQPALSRRSVEGLIVNVGLMPGSMSNLGGGELALQKYWLIRKVPLLMAGG